MNEIENEYLQFWIKDDILFSRHKRITNIELKEAREIIELRHKISNGVPQYWCMHLCNIRSASNEAHHYVAEFGQDFVDACAVVANSFLSKFIVDVFIKAKKPRVPMKIFTSEEEAVAWLKEMKKKKEITNILNKCLN